MKNLLQKITQSSPKNMPSDMPQDKTQKMPKDTAQIKTQKKPQDFDSTPAPSLYSAIVNIKTEQQAEHFLQDLCTPAELKAFKERWLVAVLLYQHQYSYRQIHSMTGISTTTIGRVARFLHTENNNGYTSILDTMNKELEND